MKFKGVYLGFAVLLVNHGLYGMEPIESKCNFNLLKKIEIKKPLLESKNQDVAPINEQGITIPITNFQPDGLFYQIQDINQMKTLHITKELDTPVITITNIPDNYLINNVGYSPDGNYVVYTASLWKDQIETKNLVIMDTQSQEIVNQIENPFGSSKVYTISLMFSPDSKKLVASSYGTLIKIFDVTTMKSVDLVSEDACWVSSCFNPNFTLLVGGDEDGYLTIFNLETNEKIERHKAHDQRIARVQFSPDGAYFATGSFDNSIKIWQTDQFRLAQYIPDAANQVSVIAWTPDGKYVASGSWAGGHITDDFNKFWNVETGTCIQKMPVLTPTFDIQFSKDAKHLMTSQGWPLISVNFWEGNITGDESN
jgi:WD40 repeat protein